MLVVDDDPTIRELIADYLGSNELRVTAAADGRAMQAVLASRWSTWCVLDLKLGAEDGMALARRMRDESEIPIIMLTGRARGSRPGDGTGARRRRLPDQAFQPARAARPHPHRAAPPPRRSAQGRPEGVRAYRFDGWELNLNTRRLSARDGRIVPLCNGEFSLLVVLLGAPSACSRATSCSTCRGCTTTRSTTARSTCRSCACGARSSRIRRKPRYIQTERGAGYIFGVPVETVY